MVKSDITLCTVFANGTPLTIIVNTAALVSTAFVQYKAHTVIPIVHRGGAHFNIKVIVSSICVLCVDFKRKFCTFYTSI